MKKSLTHLPEDKRAEVERVRDIILTAAKRKIEMLILFGSFARGDWVEDRYVEDKTLYEYKSDFDLLIVVRTKKAEQDHGLWNTIEHTILDDPQITTPVSIVVDTIDFINMRLREGNYFYTDLKQEGVELYNSGKQNFSRAKHLSPKEQRSIAERDFLFWFQKADESLDYYKIAKKKSDNSKAAFELHQATEALFVASMLVATGYRPKTHDLTKLEKKVVKINSRFKGIFPVKTAHDKKLFDLLRRAYVDARYKADYKVTAKQLDELYARILKLKRTTKKVCTERITDLH